MADGIQLNTGALGDVLAADLVSGQQVQRVKPQFGEDGTATDVSAANPLPVAATSNGPVNLILSRHLDTNGDGTGSKDAIGDYSTTQGVFKITPPAGTIYRIARMIVCVADSAGMAAEEYGNLGAALANGITLRIHNGTSTVVDLVDSFPITTNSGWARLCYDADLKSWGAGDELLVARWTFAKSGVPLRLDGDATESLEVLLDDDLQGLIGHNFLVQGYTENTPT